MAANRARLRAIRRQRSGPTITASTAVIADTRANVLCIPSTYADLRSVPHFGPACFLRTFLPKPRPTLRVRALADRVEHALVLQAVLESWLDAFSIDNGFHEIGHGVNESVFVADDVTGRPPLVDVRMRWFGHDDIAETLSILRVAPAEKFQAIHFFQIEKQ